MSRPFCSFVIPAYNEARRIPATLAAVAGLSSSELGVCEIIVVDDGSTDSTPSSSLAFDTPVCPVRVLRRPHRGKGAALRSGVSVARGEFVILCDADLGDSVREVRVLMTALNRSADIAIGSRWLRHLDCLQSQPIHRRVASRAYNLLAGCVLALPFKDTQCGLKALKRKAADRVFPLLSLDGWGYDAELIYVGLALGLRVEEVDLELVHDYRDSRFHALTDGWGTFMTLFQIRWNNLRGAYSQQTPVALEMLSAAATDEADAQENAA